MSDTLTYLMGNRWTKNVEGEFISIKDAYVVPLMNLSVDGKSTQITTTGKNLLDPIVDYTVGRWLKRRLSSNGYGTVISSGGTTCGVFLVPLENGQSLTYSRNTGLKPGFHYVWTTDRALNVDSVLNNIVTLTNYSRRTFTNNTGDTIYVGVAASVNAATISNSGYMVRAQAQLEYATEFTSYEPYSGGVASPNPTWPQEIISIDDLNVNYFGRNIIDQAVIEQGSVSSACLDTESTTRCRIPESVFIGFLNGVTVVCTGNCLAGNFEYAIVGMRNSIYVSSGWLQSGASYTVPNDITSIRMIFRSANDAEVTPENFSNIQLEVGSYASQYEQYVGNVVQFLPDGYSLRSLPDGTKDKLHLTYLRPSDRPGWAWYDRELVKRVDIRTLDGSETYTRTGGRFYVANHLMKRLNNYSDAMICDSLKCYATHSSIGGSTESNFVEGISGYRGTGYAGQNWLYIAPTIARTATVDEFKTWLTEHPVTVQYELATPVTTQFDPIELPAMQSGLTNLWSDPSINLSIIYERDKNIVISNMKATIDDLATS